MGSKTKENCFLGGFSAKSKYNGAQHVDETVEANMRDPHGLETFSKHAVEYDQDAFNFARLKGNFKNAKGFNEKAAAIFQEATGIKWQHMAAFPAPPEALLTEAITGRILKESESLIERFPTMTRKQYNEALRSAIKDTKAKIANMDPILQSEAYDWVDFVEKGGDFFRPIGAPETNVVAKLAGNAVSNLVTNNPAIALYNVLEFTPKALVYAIKNNGADAPRVMIQGITDYIKATGGIHKFWNRIPELEAKGIYSNKATGVVGKFAEKKFGVGNILDTTENPLRGLSYYLGEASAKGMGQKALEDIAFVHRPNNTPKMLRSVHNKATVSLMRFSISTMQMYGGLVKSAIVDKNPQAAAALAAFHIMTAIQSGAQSTIPLPVWAALPDDTKEQIKSVKGLDSLIGLNLADSQQPLGGVAFGLGYNIATSDLAALSKIPKGIKAGIQDGDWGNAAYEGSLGLLMAAQLGRIPGVNLTTVRLYKAAAKGWVDNEANAGYISKEYLDSIKVLAKD